MKKITLLVLCAVTILAVLCIVFMAQPKEKEKITPEEAERLCLEILGDKAEETGFPMSCRCMGTFSENDKTFYVIEIRWLVNNSHFSYIGNCFVNLDGNEIYNGIAIAEEIKITDLLWKK